MKILDRKLFGLGLATALGVVVLDQVSKAIMVEVMASHPFGIVVLPVFSLVSAWNTGVSFSMLRNAGPWLLSGGAILVSVGLLAWLTRIETLLTAMGIGCVAGGALGNVIDRLRAGAVFDFLDFYIRQADGREWHWPAFNLADSGITVGVVLLLIDGLFHRAGSAKSKAS